MIHRMIITALSLAVFAGCERSDTKPEIVTFEFVHTSRDEKFVATTNDPSVIAQARAELSLPLEQRIKHINGVIEKDGNGENKPWSWRFKPSVWGLSEMSIELCDSWPSYIEENLEDWLENPGTFCPWSSRVAAEIN